MDEPSENPQATNADGPRVPEPINAYPEVEPTNTELLSTLRDRKEHLRNLQQKLRTDLDGLRSRISQLQGNVSLQHETKKPFLDRRIRTAQRELGTLDYVRSFQLSSQEIDDLIVYVNNNPYLRSLLEKRNPRLLHTLLNYPALSATSSTPETLYVSQAEAVSRTESPTTPSSSEDVSH
ncbi:hypothetical protein RvY_12322 [Ramazzottius varieornatus]|uniref:Uncharacterized protein n=1 Tax=Ramazzottius varieornatus TaxID=947166 RepID=A0A1D1VRR5_RAMVA|nr:hypothetical protein RvY_12322 [Ramazzottius varieornatus]